ncbi:MAG: trimethylamine--corrinoid protein Co-methyltransferase, partial [Dinoroseobacter sp.]
MNVIAPRRSGGRAARRAIRAAPVVDALRSIRPGMSGGSLKVLSPEQIDQIHEAAIEALETIGLVDAPESGIAYMTGVGAILGEDGRIRFPRAVVEEALEKSCKDLTLHGRDPRYDLHLLGTKVHYGTAGAAVNMVDVEGRNYRDSTVQDLHDACRICDVLDNIHFVQRPMVARDIPNNRELDLNTIYACCSGTNKHIGTSFSEPDFVTPALELLHMIAGGEDAWRARP